MRFLKKLFQKEKVMTLSEVIDWYEQEKIVFTANSKEPYLKESFEELFAITNEIKEKIVALHDTPLLNPNLSKKEETVLKGNLKAYEQNVLQTVDDLEISISYERDKISSQYDASRKRIIAYQKQAIRQIQILSHFYANEVAYIHKKIGSILRKYEEMIQYFSGPFFIIEESIQQYNARNSVIKNVQKRNKTSDKEKHADHYTIKKLEQAIQNYKSSKEYVELQELVKNRLDIEKELHTKKNELFSLFGVLDRGLKKYAHIGLEEHLTDFISDPIHNFHKNGATILQGLEKSIQSKSIELKNNDKVIESSKILRKNAESMIAMIKELEKTITEIAQKESEYTVSKDIEKIEIQIYELKNKEYTKKSVPEVLDINKVLSEELTKYMNQKVTVSN